MKKTATWISLALLVLVPAARAEDASLSVTSQRKHIYLDESFQLTVQVAGARPTKRPDTSAIKDCQIDFLGKHTAFSFEQSGRYIRRVSSQVYQYQITPDSAGVFRAGPIKVDIDGKTYSTPGPLVRVTGIEKQDDVIIRVISSRKSVLADEPFEITLSIAIKAMTGDYARYDPLNRGDPPRLDIPYLQPHTHPPRGLESERLVPLLERLVTSHRSPGFLINGQRARFALNRRPTTLNKHNYYEYSLKLQYVPKVEGSYQFGPVVFKGTVLAGIRSGQLQGKQVFAVGPACTVRVIPPPEEGRPDSYCGAIGKDLSVNAQLDTQTCNVGDPLTLTLTLTGDINARGMYPPVLNDQNSIIRNFRIYDDTVRTKALNNGREYKYTIRPVRDGTFELPAIPVSFFDRINMQYKTVYTRPLPLRANASAEFNPENIVGPSPERILLIQKERNPSLFVPAPVAMSPAGFVSVGLGWRPWHGIVGASAPLIYFLLAGYMSARRRSRKGATGRRQRAAASTALALIKKADQVSGENPADTRKLLLDALRQYVADKCLVSRAGLTPGDARELLKKNKAPADLADSFASVMEQYFNAGFASPGQQGTGNDSDLRKAKGLIEQLETALSGPGEGRT